MEAATDAKMPWVITQLNTRLFALNCAVVREMVIMPEVCEVPGVPEYVRGVINLRGRVTPLVDLRRRLGLRSSHEETEELCALMEQRAQDHKHWLDELEASVKEKRKFTLARDPHQCAFGKWYYNFKTDNILLSGFLKRFDAPHQKIHALAGAVEQMLERGCGGDEGCAQKALEMFNEARSGVLSTMLRLFADFQQMIRDTHREIAVVLHGQAGMYAVSVDSVASVERLAAADMEGLADKGLEQRSGLVTSVAKRAKGGGLVLILAPDAILDAATQAELVAS
ncbi:MAG TPA: chemotaxis protein CheW [Bryobacteraceae bacterium]|nr:chemotaxis protein CheW [Bryobacteraceae bacterium]